MPRRSGSEKRKRSCMLTARFNQQEAEAIRLIADKSGLSVGSLIRRALLDAAPPPSRRRPSVNYKAVAQVLGQLGKIGSNINQLAHAANLGRTQLNSIELALRDLTEMRTACLRALGHEPERPRADDDNPA